MFLWHGQCYLNIIQVTEHIVSKPSPWRKITKKQTRAHLYSVNWKKKKKAALEIWTWMSLNSKIPICLKRTLNTIHPFYVIRITCTEATCVHSRMCNLPSWKTLYKGNLNKVHNNPTKLTYIEILTKQT